MKTDQNSLISWQRLPIKYRRTESLKLLVDEVTITADSIEYQRKFFGLKIVAFKDDLKNYLGFTVQLIKSDNSKKNSANEQEKQIQLRLIHKTISSKQILMYLNVTPRLSINDHASTVSQRLKLPLLEVSPLADLADQTMNPHNPAHYRPVENDNFQATAIETGQSQPEQAQINSSGLATNVLAEAEKIVLPQDAFGNDLRELYFENHPGRKIVFLALLVPFSGITSSIIALLIITILVAFLLYTLREIISCDSQALTQELKFGQLVLRKTRIPFLKIIEIKDASIAGVNNSHVALSIYIRGSRKREIIGIAAGKQTAETIKAFINKQLHLIKDTPLASIN